MTRISTMASNSILLDTIFRTQQRVLDSQIQVATEKRSQDYQGIAGNSRRLVNIENSSAALERFISNNEQQDVRFQITENVMESVKDTVLQFRNQLSNYASGEKRDRERAGRHAAREPQRQYNQWVSDPFRRRSRDLSDNPRRAS